MVYQAGEGIQREFRQAVGRFLEGSKEVFYDLKELLEGRKANGIIFTTMQKFEDKVLALIDKEYDLMAANADPNVIERSKKELGQMESILGNDRTIDSLVRDILYHYEHYRANLLTGKAMIVAYSRAITMKIYEKILELRPSWTDKVAVVMTSSNKDPEEWNKIIGNKHHKDELAKEFKDNNSPLKIAIVVDMWLTADELAFYDALTKPQVIKDFYPNEELIAMTKELADTLRRNRTIDWQKLDSARAKMRMMIKRLLKKNKYPPEGMGDAVQTVMTQCELWADNDVW